MKKQSIDWAGDTIKIAYGNGQKFERDCMNYPRNIYTPCDAARHGIAQKMGDAKSGGTAAEKYAEVLAIDANLLAGEWNRRATGSVEGLMERAYQIIAQALGKADDVAAGWLTEYLEKTDEEREAIRAKPHMKSAIGKAKAERGLAGIEDAEDFDPNA